jgi:hypothetical protein
MAFTPGVTGGIFQPVYEFKRLQNNRFNPDVAENLTIRTWVNYPFRRLKVDIFSPIFGQKVVQSASIIELPI